MYTTDATREYSELEKALMGFMIWASGSIDCETHRFPHVAHGIMVCPGAGCPHWVCRGCAKDVAEQNARRLQQERDKRRRAEWN